MSIERFFGKGRAAEAKPRDKDEPKPRRSHGAPSEADSKAPRTAAATPPARSGGETAGARTATASVIEAVPGASQSPSPTYEEIAARAYDLWQEQGRPEGRDHENWIEAERQLRTERAGG